MKNIEFAGLEIVIRWSWLETSQNSSNRKLLKQSVLSLGHMTYCGIIVRLVGLWSYLEDHESE